MRDTLMRLGVATASLLLLVALLWPLWRIVVSSLQTGWVEL